MINKIGFEFGKRIKSDIKENNNKNNSVSNPDKFKSSAGKLNINYFVPFTGKKDKSNGSSKFETIMFHTDTSAKNLISKLEKEAKETGYDKITTLHVLKHGFNEVNQYIDDLESGKKDYSIDPVPPMAEVFQQDVSNKLFGTSELRLQLQMLLNNYCDVINEVLKNKKPNTFQQSARTVFSDDLTDSIWGVNPDKNLPVNDYTIMRGAYMSTDDVTYDIVENMLVNMYQVFMENNKALDKRAPFSEYEPKVQTVLKNLSLGTNVFVTYDGTKEVPFNFLDTVKKALNENDRMTYTELNYSAKAAYLPYLISKLSKDKSRQHIIAMDPTAMMQLATQELSDEVRPENAYIVPPELNKILINQPSNIKFLFFDTKDNYYAISSATSLYSRFLEAPIPVLSTKQMVKSFLENSILLKDINVPFTDKAIEKTVEASARLDGVFPLKTQELMKKIAGYYVDNDIINENDVANYINEATNLFKKDTDESSVDVIFDTGKKIKDMVGKASTQKEVALLVKQIKTNKLGTKGIILYSQDGSAGSGRRHTAKAIAGEAGIPYIEMNAVDFGTKDVDLFGGGALSPEKAVKKLFSLVKTQAEANTNKSAVLFIENFEYFTLGEMVSFYHQKAMAQLLREMEKADEAGLNILVAGSVSDPSLIGEATMKSFKFVDTVEVSSPAFNKQDRAAVIKHALENNNVKLAGSSEIQEKSIDYAAEITQYFPFIQLKNFVKKAQSVADERGHKSITKGDLTEAYLQLTTGRPASTVIEQHSKNIVASHECGHAVNLEVMNNVAKTIGRPWHIPSKVNFVTLDPRGYYGGAVYHGNDKNDEYSFEYMFGNLVCSFGGNSAESIFYGIDGSFGITCDMESVRRYTNAMVKSMGMGPKTGKMTIGKLDDLSDKMKEMIEDDERVIINNAKITSDMITEIYSDFNKWFTEKYSPLVGTGECLIDGDEFRDALNKWKSQQSPKKQKELELCDRTIVQIMEATKKGIAVKKA